MICFNEKYLNNTITCFAETVLPAPDSPEMMTDWLHLLLKVKGKTS